LSEAIDAVLQKALTPGQARRLLENLHTLPLAERVAMLEDIEHLEHAEQVRRCKDDFLAFCKHVYPNFKEGPHHRFVSPILKKVVEGTEERLTVSMPPRFGKSETIAYLFVAWYLGHHPDHYVIMVTHTAGLSTVFGRKVRNLIESQVYREIFPGTIISKDKTASDDWATTRGGTYLAVGVGGNIAGYGAHLLVADDLVSEQAVMANPDTAFENAWKYMQAGPLQRLMPDGRIIMIGCMTAETRVLMADGAEKELQHIKVGDEIATYDNGEITTSRVLNWIKHPSDFVYKIRTTSGKIVRANKRHPFLVDRDGVRTWVRVRNLKVGDLLVEAAQPQGASDRSKPRGCASCATGESSGQMGVLANAGRGLGASGAAWSVPPKGAASRSGAAGFASAATTKLTGAPVRAAQLKRKSAKDIFATATAFLQKLTTLCSRLKAAVAPFVSNLQPKQTPALDGPQSYTSTTATEPSGCAGCSATTATWQSDTPSQSPCCEPLPSTYVATTAAIVEIVEDGFEPVFDMEVERTENFIANGVVSHNTRWGKKDPIGRALSWATDDPHHKKWHEIRFPAILPSGKSLWPEQWPVDQLLAKKAGMTRAFWNAQYMQDPTSEEGALLKREWWNFWLRPDPPPVEFIIQSWDTAHETKTHNDFSACGTWGVWFNEKTNRRELMLLDAFKDRWEFPQLKKKALETYKKWDPECLIIEKKASGGPLIQELRQMDMIVEEFSPSRGRANTSNDKRARVNAVSTVFSDGLVWVPDLAWAREVVDECADFPNGEFDDFVDMTTLAVSRYRRGGFVVLSDDRPQEELIRAPRRTPYY
jgi:predicted phage terminase large subunit-like protein